MSEKNPDSLVRILDKYSSEFNTRKGWKANDKCPRDRKQNGVLFQDKERRPLDRGRRERILKEERVNGHMAEIFNNFIE